MKSQYYNQISLGIGASSDTEIIVPYWADKISIYFLADQVQINMFLRFLYIDDDVATIASSSSSNTLASINNNISGAKKLRITIDGNAASASTTNIQMIFEGVDDK